MTEVIVKIKKPSELEKLFKALDELKIEFRTHIPKPPKNSEAEIDAIYEQIRNGAFNIPNFEEFMKEFEESRQDRPLPGRD